MYKKPIVVAFEGIDGAGKTTLIDTVKPQFLREGKTLVNRSAGSLLRKELEERNRRSLPSNLILIEEVSNAFKNTLVYYLEAYEASCSIEADFMFLDRYRDSFFVRQISTRGNDEIVKSFYGLLPKPDVTVFVDTTVNIAFDRVIARGGERRGDGIGSLKRMAELYKETNLREHQTPLIQLDGRKTKEDLFSNFIDEIKSYRLA